MSVPREADRQKEAAEDAVEKAIAAMSEIVIKECDGFDGWPNHNFPKVLSTLLDVRLLLRGQLS